MIRANGDAKRGVSRSTESGMTLIEVLIAIMLFVVFTGVTALVTELLAAMLSSDQKTTVVGDCGAPPLDRACIDQYFDSLVPTLQASTFSVANLRQSMRQCKPSPGILFQLNFAQIPAAPWPPGYEVCIYDYGAQKSAFAEDVQSGRPGLYLLQAQPVAASPLKRPVQRLFCRPRILCG